MSCSLYYTAKRNTSLTDTENKYINNIVEKYNSEYPFSEKSEDFCVYSTTENGVIFSGATKLPYIDDFELSFEICEYWLECLTEITKVLHDCQWNVSLDDVSLIYSKDTGWRFPTDNEYKK